jgi:hypothetical protein
VFFLYISCLLGLRPFVLFFSNDIELIIKKKMTLEGLVNVHEDQKVGQKEGGGGWNRS